MALTKDRGSLSFRFMQFAGSAVDMKNFANRAIAQGFERPVPRLTCPLLADSASLRELTSAFRRATCSCGSNKYSVISVIV